MIYFIQGEQGGPIKIGYTSGDARGRLGELQTGSPILLRLLSTVEGGRLEEARLHHRFGAVRLHGEWFRPVPALIELAGGVTDALPEWPPEHVPGPPTLISPYVEMPDEAIAQDVADIWDELYPMGTLPREKADLEVAALMASH